MLRIYLVCTVLSCLYVTIALLRYFLAARTDAATLIFLFFRGLTSWCPPLLRWRHFAIIQLYLAVEFGAIVAYMYLATPLGHDGILCALIVLPVLSHDLLRDVESLTLRSITTGVIACAVVVIAALLLNENPPAGVPSDGYVSGMLAFHAMVITLLLSSSDNLSEIKSVKELVEKKPIPPPCIVPTLPGAPSLIQAAEQSADIGCENDVFRLVPSADNSEDDDEMPPPPKKSLLKQVISSPNGGAVQSPDSGCENDVIHLAREGHEEVLKDPEPPQLPFFTVLPPSDGTVRNVSGPRPTKSGSLFMVEIPTTTSSRGSSIASSPPTTPTTLSLVRRQSLDDSDGHLMEASPKRASRVLNRLNSLLGIERKSSTIVMQKTLNWKKGPLLGVGAYGQVHLGLNQDTGELMAVKHFDFDHADPSLQKKLQMLQNEITILKRLDHENIVRYFFVEKVEHGVNIFMEYVPGGSIQAMMSKFGSALDERVVVQYTHQILLGLGYLHRNNVLHSDIKGANLLVTVEGIVKLADFGSATIAERISNNGTPVWMAPEVIRGETAIGMSSDIWSLGCTVMEMLTGKTPWAHIGNTMEIMSYVADVERPIIFPSGLSDGAHSFLYDCLQRSAEGRPSAEALLAHHFFYEAKSLEEQYQAFPAVIFSPASAALLLPPNRKRSSGTSANASPDSSLVVEDHGMPTLLVGPPSDRVREVTLALQDGHLSPPRQSRRRSSEGSRRSSDEKGPEKKFHSFPPNMQSSPRRASFGLRGVGPEPTTPPGKVIVEEQVVIGEGTFSQVVLQSRVITALEHPPNNSPWTSPTNSPISADLVIHARVRGFPEHPPLRDTQPHSPADKL